ncbi:MAG: autotransporter outer membrane beta-barrel domain-containing protein [Deltaproteobacteria bacterium]|nr:autotransporter outer membrane beta-barrel domain-containing protein [Deltaproteobacteria bacterium]
MTAAPLRAADITDGASLGSEFAGASNGNTLNIGDGAVIDLNQNGVVSALTNITLEGAASMDFKTAIAAEATGIIAEAKNGNLGEGDIKGLIDAILENLPNNRIFNSDPQAYGSGLIIDGDPIASDERLLLGAAGTASSTKPAGNDTAWATILGGNAATAVIQKLALYNGSVANAANNGATTGAASDDVTVVSSRNVTVSYDTDALEHGGDSAISVSGDGFKLVNVNFEGTRATVAATDTGASTVYLGLIGTNVSRDATINAATTWVGIENSTFINNVIETDGAVHTVGNVLFFSNRHYPGTGYQNVPNGRGGNGEAGLVSYYDKIDHISGSVFIGNKFINDSDANVGLRTWGPAGPAWVKMNAISGSLFANNYNQGHHAFGGAMYLGSVVTVENSVFYNNEVVSDHEALGGAIYADSVNTTASGAYSDTGRAIDLIDNSVFIGNSAKFLYELTNGGADGLGGADGGAISATNGILKILDSLFLGNFTFNDAAGGDAVGGAISSGIIETIENSLFAGNYASAEEGGAEGGAILMTIPQTVTNNAVVTIKNSQFLGNSVVDDGDGVGGAIAINLTQANSPPGGQTFTLNLTADNASQTVFSGNSVNDAPSGVYIGGPQRDVTIGVNAASGATVNLSDPLQIALSNSKSFALTDTSAGTFIWGGRNDIVAPGGATVTFSSDSGNVTELTRDFQLYSSGGSTLNVVFNSNNKIVLDFTGRDADDPFFKDATTTSYSSAKFEPRFQSLVDATVEYTIGTGSGFTGPPTLLPYTDPVTGVTSTLTFTSGGKLQLEYSGTDALFEGALPNVLASRAALSEAIGAMAPFLGFDEQQAAFEALVGDLPNATAEPFLSQVSSAMEIARSLGARALSANQLSREDRMAQNALAPAAGSADGLSVRGWLEYIGSHIRHKSENGYSGYKTTLNGALVGLSFDYPSGFGFGGWLSYSDGDTDFDWLTADIDSEIFQAGLFAEYRPLNGGFSGILDVSYASVGNDSVRRNAGNRYNAAFNQKIFGLGLRGGYEFTVGNGVRLTPFASVNYLSLKQEAFRETGVGPAPGAAIDSPALSKDSVTATVGLDIRNTFATSLGDVTPSFNIGWRHQGGDARINGSFGYVGLDHAVTAARADVSGAELKRSSLELGTSLTIRPGRSESGLGVRAGYNASVRSHHVEHNYYAGLEYSF